jgi:hypothetical protein
LSPIERRASPQRKICALSDFGLPTFWSRRGRPAALSFCPPYTTSNLRTGNKISAFGVELDGRRLDCLVRAAGDDLSDPSGAGRGAVHIPHERGAGGVALVVVRKAGLPSSADEISRACDAAHIRGAPARAIVLRSVTAGAPMPEKRKPPDSAVFAGIVIFLLALAVLFAVADLTPIIAPGLR